MTQVSLPQVTQTTVKLVEEIRDVNASLSRSWLVSNSHWRVYPLPLSPHGKLPFFPLPLPLSHCSCHRQAMTGAWGDPLLWSSICSRSNDNGYAACLRLRICIWSAANKACKERSSPWENIDQWKVWRGSTCIKHIIKPKGKRRRPGVGPAWKEVRGTWTTCSLAHWIYVIVSQYL